MELTPPEIRVLGCLLEKQRTTPDGYPLSLNALRTACNQSTNRDPVVRYDEATVREALDRLGHRRWTRLASGRGSRAPKFRHLLDDALPMNDAERAVLTVLMLRGAQTPGELKSRAGRLHHLPDLAAVGEALDGLADRGLAARLPRRPGQKEERYAHLLGGDPSEGGAAAPASAGPPPRASAPPSSDAPEPSSALPPSGPSAAATPPSSASPAPGGDDRLARVGPSAPEGDDRLARLEDEVEALRARVRDLEALVARVQALDERLTEAGG